MTPSPTPAQVAAAEAEPMSDLDHARYDRDGWMESALRARAELAAALARAERAEAVLTEACQMQSIFLMAGEMTAQERRTARAVANGIAAKIRAALAQPAPAEEK